MITEADARKHLAGLLLRQFELEDFEDWLVQQSWNMHLDSSQAAQELVSAIELALSEHSSDHISERELRDRLLSLFNERKVSISVSTDRVIVSPAQPRPRSMSHLRLSQRLLVRPV